MEIKAIRPIVQQLHVSRREGLGQTIEHGTHGMINGGKITNYINFIFMFFAMLRISAYFNKQVKLYTISIALSTN